MSDKDRRVNTYSIDFCHTWNKEYIHEMMKSNTLPTIESSESDFVVSYIMGAL